MNCIPNIFKLSLLTPRTSEAIRIEEWWMEERFWHRNEDQKVYPRSMPDYTTPQFHSFRDLPAIVEDQDKQQWYQNGKRHRDNDQPAVIWYAEGTRAIEEWWRHGRRHRDNDQPFVVFSDEAQRQWWNHCIYINGQHTPC